MTNPLEMNRPPFNEPLQAWKSALSQRGFPTDLIWLFDENLCFEEDAKSGFKLGFQTRFTPPPQEAAEVAYDHFCEFTVPIIFYRLGSCQGKSLCLLLCDEWFRSRGEKDGFLPREEWLIAFRPGETVEIEEIADQGRWQQRQLRNRPLHDLDFCMTLRGVHEILAHGRVLTSYEHYALKLLGAWRRLVTPSQ